LPSHISRYEIRKELGRGMMGVVYEVHDPALRRTIALKTIHLAAGSVGDRAEYERRFLAEARIAARLSHPGIVVVHDVGRDEEKGILFIALEHLHGRTLAQMADEGRPDWRDALRIVARVAEALDYAHAHRVVHRDIKPANIMVLPSGLPKIMDFGIAKLEAVQHTAAGQFMGTPLYMAPEQALGQPVDGRTDVFSLGSVAYTLLAGRPAFEAANVAGVLSRVAYQEPKPLSEMVQGLPADVEYVVARAMAKAPPDRYPVARLLAEDIDDVLAGRPPRHRAGWSMPRPGERTIASGRLEEPVVEQELQLIDEEAPPPPAPRRRRRRPAAALVVLLLAAAGCFYLRGADRSFWRAMLDSRRALGVAATVGEVSSGVRTWLGKREASPAMPSGPAASPTSGPSDPPLSPVALATPEAFDPPEPIFGHSVPAPAPTDSPPPAAVSSPDPP
jgi:eukaryotic-like serine/threonine-protein kinase